MDNDSTKKFDFNNANLADQITVIGHLEHLYEHCLKAASTLEEEDAVFYITLADMAKNFRRDFMSRHFPEVKETDWCILKAIESVKQRVYESAHTSHEDLKTANDLWSLITEHIFEVDMSGCSACREDREKGSHEDSLE